MLLYTTVDVVLPVTLTLSLVNLQVGMQLKNENKNVIAL